jgi:hypothetical protein
MSLHGTAVGLKTVKKLVRVRMLADGNFATISRGQYRLIPKEKLEYSITKVGLHGPILCWRIKLC